MNQSELFSEYRNLLFSIAYNMLGVIEDAEDLVQETYLKWSSQNVDAIKYHKAFLVKIITNLSINQLNSAKRQRENYIGLWLPEPLVKDKMIDSFKSVDLYHSLSIGMMVLLEKLAPSERAVFLLKEVFSYEYSEIAEIISKSEDNCRQIFSRAKKHLGGREKRFQLDVKVHEKMLKQFLNAIDEGSMEGLIGLLRDDIELLADGGGSSFTFGDQKFSAFRNPIIGVDHVSKSVITVVSKIRKYAPNRVNKVVYVNGLPSILAASNGVPYCLICLEISDEKISNIYVHTNPDKIKNL